MSLKGDKQQNIQMELDFSSALTGAARGVAGEETESLMATSGPESPARAFRILVYSDGGEESANNPSDGEGVFR